jgi:hypothetical protein
MGPPKPKINIAVIFTSSQSARPLYTLTLKHFETHVTNSQQSAMLVAYIRELKNVGDGVCTPCSRLSPDVDFQVVLHALKAINLLLKNTNCMFSRQEVIVACSWSG